MACVLQGFSSCTIACLIFLWSLCFSRLALRPPPALTILTPPLLPAFFPYHRCGDYAFPSLPYELSVPEEQNGMYCMTISWKGFMPGSSSCYNTLSSVGGTRLIMGVGECSINARMPPAWTRPRPLCLLLDS